MNQIKLYALEGTNQPLPQCHSFIVCRTKNKEIAQKFTYVVITEKGKIIDRDPIENQKQLYQYNYQIDCSFYKIKNNEFIVANGKQIHKILDQETINNVKKYHIIKVKQHIKEVEFYCYYKQKFIPITLMYISSFLIFQNKNKIAFTNHLSLDLLRQYSFNTKYPKFYYFSSVYSILSDMHFLNSFIRGYNALGCYTKNKEEFIFVLEDVIYNTLMSIYGVTPKM